MDLKTLKELLASLNINPDEIEDERYALLSAGRHLIFDNFPRYRFRTLDNYL